MMLRLLPLLLLLGIALPAVAKSVDEMKQDGWVLTFDDEFDGPALDTTKWTPHYNFNAIINHELQAYIPDAFVFSDGILQITAKHEPGRQAGRTQQYTSGAMTTSGKFSQQYGYFEVRCKLPKGKGYWPAFWLLSDSGKWPPEIDIFENLGHENQTLHFTNHWMDDQHHPRGKGQQTNGPDYTADFHTIAVDWEPDAIVWYVDDKEQCRVTDNIEKEKMYILLNLAVGGDWPKSPDANTVFPQSFDVDYVRVYQKANQASSSP
ncbi:MAG: glycoside hydrolase family 16 protein [Verrucomicrobiota bacterium]